MNTDFTINNDSEPTLENGDFVIDGSDAQHIQMILQLQKGELKQYPEVGVGMVNSINGSIDGRVRKEIKLQLESDGYDTSGLKIIGDQIEINVPET